MKTERAADKAQEHCPHCPDQGWYVVANRRNGEPEQEQCEWCNTTPNSVYNQSQKADKAQSFEEVLGQLDMLTDGEKEWLRSVHNSNITAEREKVPPPVDNKFVADGCAQFGDTPATTEAVFIMNRSLMLENKKLQQQLEARQNVLGSEILREIRKLR